MDKKDLINKLENTELPNIRMTVRKKWLENILLEKKAGPETLGLSEEVRITMKGVISTMRNMLTSRQPVWRTVLASVLATAMVVSLSVILPSFLGQSKGAMAAEDEVIQILKAAPETKALLDNGAVVSFLEKDYRGDVITTVENTMGMEVISHKTNIMIAAQRELVEIVLGEKVYFADVDVLNGEVLCFAEKGSPDFCTINPRFDVDVVGEMLNEEGETIPLAYNWISTQGFAGITSYIDPLYEDTMSYADNFQPPLSLE
jgi:hypothetical protein